MGKIVESTTTKKKKKGRPSLLDLQKRSLKQQQQQQQQLRNSKNLNVQNPNPNSTSPGLRRSTRRNPNLHSDAAVTDDEDRSSGKRRQKKLKFVLKLPDDEEKENSESDSNPDDEVRFSANVRKRKIDSISRGSSLEDDDKGEKHSAAAANQASTQEGCKLVDGPSTPLPDNNLLLFILDRLQKKDTYGVFAEPVDPEELPDYHEVIEHPMDFATVRKKLANGAYANLEQFEKDVFLICSNAMQYNSPDTVYFRQARTIKELATKNFENLRQDSDDNEPEPETKVVRRGRPPNKNFRRPPGRPPLERANCDFSGATLATAGGTTNRSNNEQRKGASVGKFVSTDSFVQSFYGSRFGEAYIGGSVERYERIDDMTGSSSKSISMKHGKKQIVLDESRRKTYKQSHALSCRQEPSVLTTFNGERKQLIAVGLHMEYGYARSLAIFAAKLGPVAWKVASKKIERCLPSDVKFGPGWVGENEAPAERPMLPQFPATAGQPSQPPSLSVQVDSSSAPTQGVGDSSGDRSVQKPQVEQFYEAHTPSIQSKVDDESSKARPPPSNAALPNLTAPEASASLNSSSSMRSGNPYQIHQRPSIQSRVNGLNGSYGLHFASQMGKMIGAARPSMFNFQSNPSIVTESRAETRSLRPSTENNGCGEAKMLANSSSTKTSDCFPSAGSTQKVCPGPPDLNVGFQSPGSPGSGKADSVQPDLALQLWK